jgi:hypothetical protein
VDDIRRLALDIGRGAAGDYPSAEDIVCHARVIEAYLREPVPADPDPAASVESSLSDYERQMLGLDIQRPVAPEADAQRLVEPKPSNFAYWPLENEDGA